MNENRAVGEPLRQSERAEQTAVAPWSWLDIQQRAVANGANDWSTCPACGLRVLQRVGSLHVTEEHPDIAASLRAEAPPAGRSGESDG